MGRSGQSAKRAPVAGTIPRKRKRASGRTSAVDTPLAVRTSGIDVDPDLREYVHGRLGWRLGKFARHIERLTVRFEDVNGPRGGVDTVCRIKVVISGLPSVVVEELSGDAVEAFNRADDRVERAVRHAVGRAQGRGRLRDVRSPAALPGSGATNAAIVPISTGARNFKRNTRKATAAFEDSAQPRPSRKSTRRSANRAQQGSKLSQRQTRRVSSPKARKAQAARKQ